MILAKKLLSIFSLLGSKAKMNDGIPIVNILDNDAWIGIKGYVQLTNINKIESINA